MSARRWTLVLWGATVLLVVALCLKFFVADVYRVETGSMRPTIFGGRDRPDGPEDAEHVLVRYARGLTPARFDLVVLRAEDGSAPLVKRVCGLPGEDFAIRDGDLFVNGRRLAPDAPRPEPITVFDDRWLDVERFFEYRHDGSVRREAAEWVIEGRAAGGSLLFFHPGLRDDYLDRHHQRVAGLREVNDAVLELEVRLDELAGQRIVLELVEEGDAFTLELVAEAPTGSLRLVRKNPRPLQRMRDSEGALPPEQPLVVLPVSLVAGRWIDLAFSNIDNRLALSSRALQLTLTHDYPENQPWPTLLAPGQKTLGPRVAFGAEGAPVRLRGVRIRRDLYYTDVGTYAVLDPVHLGPDEYFLLGDNSAASTDSRHFGPKDASQFLGRPLAVVWPAWRRLEGVGPSR